MFTTDEKLFCEKLDRSIPALADIDVTYKEKGLAAAEADGAARQKRGAKNPRRVG